MSASVQEEKIGGIIEQVKLDTSRRYEAKISNIESHLHELKTHNQALTSELSKWTVDDSMFEDPDGDDEREEEEVESPRRGREGDKSGGRNRYDYEGLQSVSEPSDADRSLLQLEEELDDDLNDSEHYGRPHRRRQRSATERPNTDLSSAMPSTSKARARLQQVRDSLELVASKPILHASRPGRVKNTATASQQNQQTKKRRQNGRRKKSSKGIHRGAPGGR